MAVVRRKNRDGKTIGYQVQVSIQDAGTGKRKRYIIGTYRTLKAAEKKEREARDQIDAGTFNPEPVAPAKVLTVAELLTTWLEGHKAKGNTLKQYEIAVRLHLIPALGTLPVTELDGPTLQRTYNQWEKLPKDKGGKGADTIRRCHIILNQAFEQALTWGTVTRNPCHGVKHAAPKPRKAHILTVKQAQEIVMAMDAHPLRPYFYLVMFQGMRRGEALGLRWSDVDLDRGIAVIQQTITPDFANKGKAQVGDTKTTAVTRRVRLSPETIEALKGYRKVWATRKLAAGKEWGDADLITCTDTGQPITPNHADAMYRQLRRMAGIPETVRLHDLRHTHASFLIQSGENPKAIQERLGHKRVSTTLDIYGHLMTDMQDTAASAMGKLIWSDATGTDDR
jgi:integrase